MGEWIDNIISEIFNALKAFGNWFVELLLSFGQGVIALVIDLLPTDANGTVSSGWSVIESGLLVANAWVPLDLAISLASVYVVFVMAFLSTKVLVKMIP